MGGLTFIELRDRSGSLQCVWDPALSPADASAFSAGNSFSAAGVDAATVGELGRAALNAAGEESVISVHGIIRPRATAARVPKGKTDAAAETGAKEFRCVSWATAAAAHGPAALTAASSADGGSVISCSGPSPFSGLTASADPHLPPAPSAAAAPVELVIASVRVLNPASPLPGVFFPPRGEALSDEATRHKARYIDLRRPPVQAALAARARIASAARAALTGLGFREVETPTLVKSTPEGAREFLVPSRARGQFYALPQSPQQHKQLLMAGGVERYFQLARCYRDEHGRQDRQPEFTQIDLEMSFVDREGVMAAVEAMVAAAHEAQFGVRPALPLPRMQYREAIDRFGSDQPDLRYGLPLHDITGPLAAWAAARAGNEAAAVGEDTLLARCEAVHPSFLPAYAAAAAAVAAAAGTPAATPAGLSVSAASGAARGSLPCVKAIVIRGAAQALSRSKAKPAVAAATGEAVTVGNPDGVLLVHSGKWKPPAGKYPALSDPAVRAALTEQLSLGEDDLLVIAAGPWETVSTALGRARAAFARLLPPDAPDAAPIALSNSAGVPVLPATAAARASAATSGVLPPDANPGPLPSLLWVTDFPLFDIDIPRPVLAAASTERACRSLRANGQAASPAAGAADDKEGDGEIEIVATHHPFTTPLAADAAVAAELLAKFPPVPAAGHAKAEKFPLSFAELCALQQVRAQHYDLVANGLEVGGGSVRVHSPAAQEAVFRALGVSSEKFGHLLAALGSGCPPHGGFAGGLDRLTSIFGTGTGAALPLREVMAFPKTLTGRDVMLGAPSPAVDAQLVEYHVSVREATKEVYDAAAVEETAAPASAEKVE